MLAAWRRSVGSCCILAGEAETDEVPGHDAGGQAVWRSGGRYSAGTDDRPTARPPDRPGFPPRGVRHPAARRHRRAPDHRQPPDPSAPARRAGDPPARARHLPLAHRFRGQAARRDRCPRGAGRGRAPDPGDGHVLRPGAAGAFQSRRPEPREPRPAVSSRRHRPAVAALELESARRARAGGRHLPVRRGHQLSRGPDRQLSGARQRLLVAVAPIPRSGASPGAGARPGGHAAGLGLRVTLLLLGALAALALGTIGAVAVALRARLARSERERRRLANELNSRLSELFSLQELFYVLSESLEPDRIVEQVVRYTMRFLDARGALVALTSDGAGDARTLVIAAAEGTLAELRGRTVPVTDPGLVARSLGRQRLELVDDSGAPTQLVDGVAVASAAAVPLRARGVVVGSLAVAEPRAGAFPAEDARLLSTVASHTAIVLANARFFDLVRRAKEQWETAFDALSEGVAVVDDAGRIRRANRALALLLGDPVADVVDQDL